MARTERNYNAPIKENLKYYFSLFKNYKSMAILGIVVIMLIQLASIGENFLFKGIIDKGEQLASGAITKAIFVDSLILLGVLFISIFLIKVFGAWFKEYAIIRLETKLMRDLKQNFFSHILYLSHKFHSEKKTGSLISRLSRGSRALEIITDVIIFSILPLLFRFSLVVATFIYFDLSTGIALLLTSSIFIWYSIWMQGKQQKSQILANRSEDLEKGFIGDVFTNVDTVKYFGKEKRIIAKYKQLSNNTCRKLTNFWDYYMWLNSGQHLILGMGTFFIFALPILALLNGNMGIGTLAFIYTTYITFVGLLFQFVHGYRGFKRGIIDLNDLYQYSKFINEIEDVKGAKDIKIEKGKISFRGVDFSYNGKRMIKDLNLVVPENSKVAIVGPSGSGKSTLVKLLFRLYDLKCGEIYIDGQDIAKVKQESLRNEMSIVPQDAILFDDSIYNNIKFSNPSASRGEVMKAIRFAQLDKLIKKLPLKENTVVGERGVKLSGGERQRVSIARAVLADKKILVLDEATSALDSQLESDIQKDLEKLMIGRTSIVIAHRLSTIMKSDIIIVVDKGKIVEAGTHGELLNRGTGLYKKLWNLQAGSFVN
ncbi:ABC transporter ATP-binding protein [Candidatus Woesearchaeota archaeon]|jgi:ATP-binding cassette, subfamily B, heavy metal transporter|nr:ABC transporter ATP-binding protein [Candidatus Woesearchaeota archaeon]